MTESEASEFKKREARDQLLAHFEEVTSKVEAALDHGDVDEVALLLSERAEALDAMINAAAKAPFPKTVILELKARQAALEERLRSGQTDLGEEVRDTRAKGRAALRYAKHSK